MSLGSHLQRTIGAALAGAVLAAAAWAPAAAQDKPPPETQPPAKMEAEKSAEPGAEGAPAPPPDLDEVRAAIGRGEAAAVADRLWIIARGRNVEAQLLLGDLHMKGEGVHKNYSLAANWYRAAADAGNAEAQFKLSELYNQGLGVPLYPEKSQEWLMKAAVQGHEEARRKLEQHGITPPPVVVEKPKPEPKREKGKIEAEAEKAIEAAGMKAAEKAEKQLEKAGMSLEQVGPSLAALMARAEKDGARARLDVGIAGHGWPDDAKPDPALEALITSYATAVNKLGVEFLKNLMSPEYKACRTDDNRAAYDAYLADGLDFTITPGWTARLGTLGADAPLPFEDLLTYPVRPGHYVRIDFEGAPRPGAEGAVELPVTVIQLVANQDGHWSLVFGCPTPHGIERLRQAGIGAAAKG